MGITIDLSGKNAILTGGGDGIGKATAKMMAEAGANIFIADLNLEAAESTAEDIRTQCGVKAWTCRCNVADVQALHLMVETAKEKMEKTIPPKAV